MRRRSHALRRPAGVALCLGLVVLPAGPAWAERAQQEPVEVINGDLSLPAFTGTGQNNADVTGWSVGSTSANNGAGTSGGVWRYSGDASGHPDRQVAVMLRENGTAYAFTQRLRGVRPGARVTVTFDDSPGVSIYCTARTVEQGQTYTVQGEGGAPQEELTEPDPDKEFNTLGSGVWRTGRTYTFTADAYEPLLTFASTVPVKPYGAAAGTGTNGGYCGPMVAGIKAVQVPPPLDKTIRGNELPPSVAFRGNDKRTVADAVAECNKAAAQCAFTPEGDYSFAYYEPARQAGENYVNCTRATLNRDRPLKYSARTISDLPTAAGLPPANATAAPSNMNGQFTGGTGTTPAWSPTAERTVKEIISPGEVSWIETQTGRQRTEGWFRSSPTPADPNQDWRLYTVVDYPSPQLADRFYQRTGPLTPGEQARCRSNRPSAETPVDAGAPAEGADRG
ncbi:hypothetical protein [Streptomyces sp. DSM 15324]|uniref:hypothetical protein n=1 Tax=Streptomyces sp. DSM 15324 TaxID=1739111 RepID=UPI000748D4C3|nr:hypothetical protein [Streptomyces sp. DSM 15324]KUO10498.1 hypothetical protein AQJ58_19050 [Streptomyces sp. DSM 15324]